MIKMYSMLIALATGGFDLTRFLIAWLIKRAPWIETVNYLIVWVIAPQQNDHEDKGERLTINDRINWYYVRKPNSCVKKAMQQ